MSEPSSACRWGRGFDNPGTRSQRPSTSIWKKFFTASLALIACAFPWPVKAAEDAVQPKEAPLVSEDWLLSYGLDPRDPDSAWDDPDGDGMQNWVEFLVGTNPTVADLAPGAVSPAAGAEDAQPSGNAGSGAVKPGVPKAPSSTLAQSMGHGGPRQDSYLHAFSGADTPAAPGRQRLVVSGGAIRRVAGTATGLPGRKEKPAKGGLESSESAPPQAMSLMSMGDEVAVETRWATATGGSDGDAFAYYTSWGVPPDYADIVGDIEMNYLGGVTMTPRDTSWADSLPDGGTDSASDTVQSRLDAVEYATFEESSSSMFNADTSWSRGYDFILYYENNGEPPYDVSLWVNGVAESKQGTWRDVRLRSDEPSDQNTIVTFVKEATYNGVTTVSPVTLTVLAGETVPRYSTTGEGSVGGVAMLRPDLMQGTTADISLKRFDIVVDDGQIGLMGDLVPSNKTENPQKHFVTPKKNDSTTDLDKEFLILKVSSYPALSAQEFDDNYMWDIPAGRGIVDPSDPRKCKISRTTPDHIVVKVRRKTTPSSGAMIDRMNVWVVWADLAEDMPKKLKDWPAGNVSSGYEGVHPSVAFIWDIKPPYIITGFNSGDDVPALDGPAFSLKDRLPPADAVSADEDSALCRWDVTRAARAKVKNPTTPPTLLHSDWLAGRGFGFGLNSKSTLFPAADVEFMQFPSDKWRGNDDPDSIDSEDNDPYTDTHTMVYVDEPTYPNPKPAIGQIGSYDKPNAVGILLSAGASGEEGENWTQFEEFARLELGEASRAKWYVISERTKWETIKKFKKVGGVMTDNGSTYTIGTHSTGY